MRSAILGALAALILVPPVIEGLPPVASVEGVVGYPQGRNLSCESRSATDVASFWAGVQGSGLAGGLFTEEEFFERLPKSDNPQRGFVGDVDLAPGSMPPDGYGVYCGPVAATLRSFGLDAQARHDWSLDGLRADLAAGRPVIVWATYEMRLPEVQTWVSSDGERSTVVKWQHTFIATGYDEEGLVLVDAYDGATKTFPYDQFIPAWDQLGRMAVTIEGPAAQAGGRVWQATEAEGRRFFVVDGRWRVGPE